MQFLAIAADYDGTLACEGRVDDSTLAALKRAQAAGLKLILVTGRELDSLRSVFSLLRFFDRIVAENGALLYDPGADQQTPLCPPASGALVSHLRSLGVPLSVGRCILATVKPHELTVRRAIRKLHLDLHIVFNHEAVMILPTGVDKATGLSCALSELSLSAQTVVGIGDAENDHGFLQMCGCSVAVANAIPALKRQAQMVSDGSCGAGVTEIITRLLETGRLCSSS